MQYNVKSVCIILMLLLIFFPKISHACIPFSNPTNSVEPVTIKIADIYFQIPEGYINYDYLRVPMERDYIYFFLPLRVFLPPPFDVEHYTTTLQITLRQSKDKDATNLTSINGKMPAVIYEYHGIDAKGLSTEIVEDYIQSIRLEEAPDTWANDVKLAQKFNLGKDPCRFSLPGRNTVENTQKASYSDIIEGLNHRNEAIRVAAAKEAGLVDKPNRENALRHLQNSFDKETSDNVKTAIVSGLIQLAEHDHTLQTMLMDIMIHEESYQIRNIISRWIAEQGSHMVHQLVPLIDVNNPSLSGHIGHALVWMINHEVRQNGITTPEQLSSNAKKALDGVITILKIADADRVVKIINELVNTFDNSQNAVATSEFVNAIAELISHEQLEVQMQAITALKHMAPVTKAHIPLFIEVLNSDKIGLYKVTIEALAAYGSHAALAVPRIIELSYFSCTGKLDAYPDEEAILPPPPTDFKTNVKLCTTWDAVSVRSHAAMAFGQIKVVNDSVIKALLRGIDDVNDQVRFYAVRSLVSISPDKEKLIPILRKMLKREYDLDQLSAIEGLGNLGKVAKPTLDDLKPYAKESQNILLQRAAIKAIQQIEGSFSE